MNFRRLTRTPYCLISRARELRPVTSRQMIADFEMSRDTLADIQQARPTLTAARRPNVVYGSPIGPRNPQRA